MVRCRAMKRRYLNVRSGRKNRPIRSVPRGGVGDLQGLESPMSIVYHHLSNRTTKKHSNSKMWWECEHLDRLATTRRRHMYLTHHFLRTKTRATLLELISDCNTIVFRIQNIYYSDANNQRVCSFPLQ